MEISYSSWPWHRSDATALAGYANMMMMMMIVNGGGDRVGKVQFSELHRRRDFDLDVESGHTAYRCASLTDLYVHTKFH